MIYEITFTNGVVIEVEAASMEDNGVSTKLLHADGSVAYWATDCEIVCCEAADTPLPEQFDVHETGQGVVLKDAAGATLAAYRNYVTE